MDLNRLTEKAQDAIRQAQSLAQREGQSRSTSSIWRWRCSPGRWRGAAHRREGGRDSRRRCQRLQQALERLPRVSGPARPAGQVYISPRVNDVLQRPRPRRSA
jgi:ATP-dependent Clp protease ATP-binding subunit ClpB